MSKIIKLGEIAILNKHDTLKKGDIEKKFTFGNEQKFAIISSDTEADSMELDLCVYPTAYMASIDERLGYYVYNGAIYFINKSLSESYFIHKKILENIEDEFEIISSVEEHFGGHSHLHITQSPNEIKNKYCKESKAKLFALAGVVFALACVVYFAFFQKSEVPVVQTPPPPPPLSLSEKQEAQLKEQVSRAIFSDILSVAKNIKSDGFRKAHEKIKSITISSIQPGIGEPGKYPKMIGTYEMIYEYDIPKIGSKYSTNNLYTESSPLTTTKEISTNNEFVDDKKITISCIKKAFDISKEVSVKSRDEFKINFLFTKIAPAEFMTNFLHYTEECPAYIESFKGMDSEYEASMVLYGKEKL
jgi:hypothetical protein